MIAFGQVATGASSFIISRGSARRRSHSLSATLPDAPFASPLLHHAVEPAGAESCDDEPAPTEGSIRLGMALPAQGDQAVAIEVRAALGALPE